MRIVCCRQAVAGALWLLGATLSSLAAPVSVDPAVKAVLTRFETAQRGVKSLRVNVVETRTLALLAKPEVLRGQLTVNNGRLRFEYREPEPRTYVLKEGRLTGWLPKQNRVEEANVSKRVGRIKRLFALGQDPSELVKDFTVALMPTSSLVGTDELVMVPTSRRVQKRIKEVRLWVDKEIGLPKQMQYVTGDGNQVAYLLSGLQLNPVVPDSTFDLQIPAGAKVVKGMQSLGLVTGATDGDEEL